MVKKCRKTFIAVLVAMCITVGFGLAGCGDTPSNGGTTTYTVTVLTDESSPAEGVKVTIKKGGATFEYKRTDAAGKVTFEMPADSYEIALADLPEHYSVAEGANLTLTASNPNLTVNLVRAFSYEIRLVNPDSTPFYAAGVTVGICTLSGNCLAPVPLGTDGVVFIEAEKGDYHVLISDLPAEYTYEQDANGYYTGELFSATDTQMTITVCRVTDVLAGTAMTDTEKNAYGKRPNVYSFNTSKEAYMFSEEVAAGAKAYIAVKTEMSGKYFFSHDDSLSYFFNGDEFKESETSGGGGLAQYHVLEGDKTYYITAVNLGDKKTTACMVVSVPDTSYVEYSGVRGTITLTVGKEYANAILAIKPAQASAYTVTTQGSALTVVNNSVYEPNETIPSTTPDGDFKAGSSASVTVMQGKVGYLGISVKADTYPATVELQIERVATASEVYSVAEVKEELTKCADVGSDKVLAGVSMDSTTQLVYNSTDGFYHLGSETGNTVYVLITKSGDSNRFEINRPLAYMELGEGTFSPTYESSYIPEGKKYSAVINYKNFIRGFEAYDSKPGLHGNELVIPETIDANCYANHVNSDGVYPLTKELEKFLKDFFNANSELFYWQLPVFDNDDDYHNYGWMFPLYYYADALTDEIIGEYEFVSITEGGNTYNAGDAYSNNGVLPGNSLVENKLSAVSVKLIIDNKGKVYIYLYDSSKSDYDYAEPYDSGDWKKEGDGYTFELTYGTMTYNNGTVTYNDTAVITFRMSSNNN